jgi:hypothetical protein
VRGVPLRSVNWHSRRTVLVLIGAACAAIFIAGMAAAFVNRHKTICSDGKPPKAQRSGILGQTEYQCRNGQVVTMSS